MHVRNRNWAAIGIRWSARRFWTVNLVVMNKSTAVAISLGSR